MKEYTFQIVIREGNDEFWESILEESDGDNIKIVKEALEDTLDSNGWINSEVTLKEFKRIE